MWILQISDIHLSAAEKAGVDQRRMLAMVGDAVDEAVGERDQLVVCICGDITSKGDPAGYDLASTFFREMGEALGHELIFCPCPGNHDIVADGRQCFRYFNKFSWRLTGDSNVLFTPLRSVGRRSIADGSVEMVLVNSAHHGDHAYGLVDLDAMEAVLEGLSPASNVIVVTHHHCIPGEVGDMSTTANARAFVELALAHGAAAILHGHVHMGTVLSIGRRNCVLIGVGSLFSRPAANFNNQFNLVQFEDGLVVRALACRFIGDLPRGGRAGAFYLKELEIL